MSCLDDDTLLAVATGQVSGPALEAAEQHLDGCPACRRALALGLEASSSTAPRTPALTVGDTLGRYVVLERVGAGAMGQVFAAWDPQLDRKVALKLLKSAASSDEHQARLLREAQTLARLSHPNVVTVFDVGRWENQRFIALEFVDGGSAREWLSGKSRGAKDVLDVFVQAGRGLAAAHQAGVVHRDFKPDNVLVRADGRAQVTDFGLASESAGRVGDGPVLEPGVSLTGTGALLGTPAYMAPAQLDGEPATAASDQFAFCVALFEALTGQRPWSGSTVEALRRAMRDGPPPSFPSSVELPAAVKRAILKGLAVQEAARWPSMLALVDALEAGSRRRSPLALLSVAAVAILAAALAFSTRSRLPQACELAQARLTQTWGEARRARLAAAFEATKLSYAPATTAMVASALDERMNAWRPQHLEACLASGTGAEEGPWRARLGCLEERVGELDATVKVLEAGGPQVVNKAGRIIDRLPQPGVCLETDALGRVPLDDATRQQVREARELGARVGALYETGAFDEAERLSAPPDGGVSEAVRSLVHFERGRVLQKLGRLDEAKATLKESALASTARRDPEPAGAAWTELAFLVGFLQSKPEEASLYVDLARALLPATKDTRLEERVEGAAGNIATRQGRLEEAEAHFARVLALAEARSGAGSALTARALTNLGNAKLRRGRIAEAVPLLERARENFERTLGAEHPDTFQTLNSLGVALGEAGRLPESVVVFERVFEGYRKTLGATHPQLATAAFNIADAHLRQGHAADALPWFERSLEVVVAGLGPTSVQRVGGLVGVAKCARLLAARARELEVLKDALTTCEAAECEPGDEAEAAWLFALASRDAGRPWPEVEAAARQARTRWQTLGAVAKPQLDAADRFLASKGRDAP